MKQLVFVFLVVTGFGQATDAQLKVPGMDKSPMDMSYYPVNYPILKIQNKTTDIPIARVVYSRPQKNGRSVFGELVEYGNVWRLGANEATEIDLYKDVKINGQKLKKGRYTMYAIPEKDKWTIIFNKETDIWGAFQYDAKKDILRTDVKIEKEDTPTEVFTMMFEKSDSGADLIMAWDDVKATLPIAF
jgi:Protein of unknown function (DUF2911)